MVMADPAVTRLARFVADPWYPWLLLRQRLFGSAPLWQRYGQRARRAGLDRLYFVLSFDCDTREDARVVERLDERLRRMGARPVYAVPGRLLEADEPVYRRLAARGAEFVNHGFAVHTFYDTRRKVYASCFFYHQQSREVVRRDIEQGHQVLASVLGTDPQGFRAPHFGTFRAPSQLRFVHQTLAALGYRFSSSTLPYQAFARAPLFTDYGLVEIPVSGMGDAPLAILDSWSCFAAPGRQRTAADYLHQAASAARRYQAVGAGVLNYYVDPLHVHDQEAFFRAVAGWLRVAVPVTYGGLLAATGHFPSRGPAEGVCAAS